MFLNGGWGCPYMVVDALYHGERRSYMLVRNNLKWWWAMSLFSGGRCPYMVVDLCPYFMVGYVIICWWEMSLFGGRKCPYLVLEDVLIWW